MYTDILVALDLESNSDAPLTTGLRLANEYGASLRVVSVIRPALLTAKGFFTAELVDKEAVIAQAREALQTRLSHQGASTLGADVLVGEPAETIAGVAQHRECDLVVVGARPRSRSETIFGTTATGVLRHTDNVSVYACHRPDPYARVERIVTAIDASRLTPHVLDDTAEFVASNLSSERPEIQIACVVNNARRYDELGDRAAEYVAASKLADESLQLMKGDVSDCLKQLVRDFDADLLMIGSGKNFGITWYVGSTTNEILHEVGCDVLVIRPND
jgi:nucleotide-binding universal stress UspA family protein